MLRISYTKQALKALTRMPKNVRELLIRKIETYAEAPNKARGVKKLVGRDGYRLRVGDWRVIVDLHEDEVTVVVIKIAPRGEVYK